MIVNKFNLLVLMFFSLFFKELSCAATIGSYDHSKQTAVIVFSTFYETGVAAKEFQLLNVNFEDQTEKLIYKGPYIEKVKVNMSFNFVAYHTGEKLNIYDLKNTKNVYSKKIKIKNIKYFWTEKNEILAGVNYSEKKYFSFNIKNNIYNNGEYNGQYLWGANWLAECNCVIFEVSDTPSSDHYLLKLDENKIVKIKNKK